MNLKDHIREVLKEETHPSVYVRRRKICFDDFIDKLENDGLDFLPPAIRGNRLDWTSYQIILTAFMRNHCEENGYYDENLHKKIMDYYGDRLYKWFKKNIKI